MNNEIKSKRQIKMQKIAHFCAECRLDKGVYQKEISSKLGTGQRYISNFERGYADSLYIFAYYLFNIIPETRLRELEEIINDN